MDRRGGFTLLELVVALAIIAIVAALTASDLSALMGRYRMNSAARDFAKEVGVTRVRSISENREYALVLVESDPLSQDGSDRQNFGRWEIKQGDHLDGSTVWNTVPDGVYDLRNGPHDHFGISLEPWQTLAGPPAYDLTDSLVFSPRGFLINVPTDFVDGVVRVVFRNKTSVVPEARVVRIDMGGNAMIAAVDPV